MEISSFWLCFYHFCFWVCIMWMWVIHNDIIFFLLIFPWLQCFSSWITFTSASADLFIRFSSDDSSVPARSHVVQNGTVQQDRRGSHKGFVFHKFTVYSPLAISLLPVLSKSAIWLYYPLTNPNVVGQQQIISESFSAQAQVLMVISTQWGKAMCKCIVLALFWTCTLLVIMIWHYM